MFLVSTYLEERPSGFSLAALLMMHATNVEPFTPRGHSPRACFSCLEQRDFGLPWIAPSGSIWSWGSVGRASIQDICMDASKTFTGQGMCIGDLHLQC